ncbi:MAG: glycosyltransferase, partial [Niabella sp.]
SLSTIKDKSNQTILLETGYNAGFARANNKGIQVATGDIILLLNPDTYVTDNSIEDLYKVFRSSSFGACIVAGFKKNCLIVFFFNSRKRSIIGTIIHNNYFMRNT